MPKVSARGEAKGRAMATVARIEPIRALAVGLATSNAVTPAMAASNAPMVTAMHKALRDAQARGIRDPNDLRRIVLDARDRHLRARAK